MSTTHLHAVRHNLMADVLASLFGDVLKEFGQGPVVALRNNSQAQPTSLLQYSSTISKQRVTNLDIELIDQADVTGGNQLFEHRDFSAFNVHFHDDKVIDRHVV